MVDYNKEIEDSNREIREGNFVTYEETLNQING